MVIDIKGTASPAAFAAGRWPVVPPQLAVAPRVSAEERLDLGNEGCLVLEQEGVAGIGVERELGSGDQAGEGVAVGERVEPVGAAGVAATVSMIFRRWQAAEAVRGRRDL